MTKLSSTSHPIEITDAMLDAGEAAYAQHWRPGVPLRDALAAAFPAMLHAAPPMPELSDDSLEVATIDIQLSDALIERVARAIAHGHGSKMTYRSPETGMMETVASQAIGHHFGTASYEYAAKYWRNYKLAAELAIAAYISANGP